MNYIRITQENIDTEHICCAMSGVPRVEEAAKEHHVLLEMNNSSLAPTSFRKATTEGYLEFLNLCKMYDQPILMGSDAHVDMDVGNHGYVTDILELAKFPEHLIINTDVEKVKPYLNYYKR